MKNIILTVFTFFAFSGHNILANVFNCPNPDAPIGYSLEKLQQIESSMDTFWCSPISFKGKPVIWIYKFVKAGNSFYGFNCKLDDKSQEESTANLSTELTEFVFDEKGSVKLIKINLPHFGMLSNPSFCGPVIAYWGTERLKEGYLLHGMIYDLEKTELLAKKVIGKDTPATGDRGYYGQPVFVTNRKSVTFPSHKISTQIKGTSIQLP